MSFFQSKGLSPEDSAALVWNFQQESGRDLNPSLSHDNGTGFGIAGFRDPTPGQGRWTNLRNFATGRGLDPASLDTQLEYSWGELNGPERATLQHIQAAQTPEQKAIAAIGYFRPRADYAAQRASRAGEVQSLLGGGSNRYGVAQTFVNAGAGQSAAPPQSTPHQAAIPGVAPYSPPVAQTSAPDGSLGSALALLAPEPGSTLEPLTPLAKPAQIGPFDGANEDVDVEAFQPRTTKRLRSPTRRA
jgi:hypothetical protein